MNKYLMNEMLLRAAFFFFFFFFFFLNCKVNDNFDNILVLCSHYLLYHYVPQRMAWVVHGDETFSMTIP